MSEQPKKESKRAQPDLFGNVSAMLAIIDNPRGPMAHVPPILFRCAVVLLTASAFLTAAFRH